MRFLLGVSSISLALLLASAQRVCNNSPALCDRQYNNVTYLGAHDSPFVRDAANGFNIFGDQYYDSTTQLDAGVRLLTAQVHHNGSSWDLCHTACPFSYAGPLTNWLSSLKTWLDNHPNDVVTILLVNSDNADASTLNQQFQAANIVDYAYVPASTTAATSDWPTLNQMIDQNKRLVVFIASLSPLSNAVAPYLLDEFTFIFENDYDNTSPTDFSCEPNRPSTLQSQSISSVLSEGYMPLMNHFLYDQSGSIEFPAEEKLETTNADTDTTGSLGNSANNCSTYYGKAPTFILVDFFNVARSITTADRLNGITGQTSGRLDLPDTVEGSKSTTVSSTTVGTQPTSISTTVSGSSTTASGGSATTSKASTSSGSGKVCRRSKWAVGGAAVAAIL